MNRLSCSMTLAAGAVAFAIFFPSLAVAQPTISAHRAVYDLDLKRKKEGSTIVGAKGRMVFELAGSVCDGWTVNFRMVNQYQNAERPARLVDSRSSSYESGDGLSMRYSRSEFDDNRMIEEQRLSAVRKPDGGGGSGKVEAPKPEEFTLPEGTIFAMQHQLRIMQAALDGKSRDASIVFDGGDGAKTYRTVTFIGPKKEAGTVVPTLATGDAAVLTKHPFWPMTLSYFSNGAVDAKGDNPDTPTYQVSFEMYGNGVADRLVLDYGDFALDGKLVNFELIDQPECK